MQMNSLCMLTEINSQIYSRMMDKFAFFGVHAEGTRKISFGVQLAKEDKESNRKEKKFQGAIITVKESPSTVVMIGSKDYKSIDFLKECEFIRCEDNFTDLLSNWSLFNEMKPQEKRTMEISLYRWGDIFEFEFYRFEDEGENEEDENVLLLMRDLASSINNPIDKVFHVSKYSIKDKLTKHFREVYITFASGLLEQAPFHQVHHQETDAMKQGEGRTFEDFETRVAKFADFCTKVSGVGQNNNEYNIYNTHEKFAPIQYWMVRLSYLAQYIFKNFDEKSAMDNEME